LWPRITTNTGRDSWRGGIRVCWIESKSITRGLAYDLESKKNITFENPASPIQSHAEDASANPAPSHEEIRRRAYAIYLERNADAGDEFDDWLRAECELQKVALLKRNWIVIRTTLLRFQMLKLSFWTWQREDLKSMTALEIVGSMPARIDFDHVPGLPFNAGGLLKQASQWNPTWEFDECSRNGT